jgi:hypothetical protein
VQLSVSQVPQPALPSERLSVEDFYFKSASLPGHTSANSLIPDLAQHLSSLSVSELEHFTLDKRQLGQVTSRQKLYSQAVTHVVEPTNNPKRFAAESRETRVLGRNHAGVRAGYHTDWDTPRQRV